MLEDIETFLINFLITGISSAIAKTTIAPLERIKVILQNQEMSLQVLKKQRAPYTGILNIIKRIPKEQVIITIS